MIQDPSDQAQQRNSLSAKDEEIVELNRLLDEAQSRHQEVSSALRERIEEKNNAFQEKWELSARVEELEAKLAKYEPPASAKKDEPKKEEPRGWFSSKKTEDPKKEESRAWFSTPAKKAAPTTKPGEKPAENTPPQQPGFASFFSSVMQKIEKEPKGTTLFLFLFLSFSLSLFLSFSLSLFLFLFLFLFLSLLGYLPPPRIYS